MTLRPFDNFDLGPVGLEHFQLNKYPKLGVLGRIPNDYWSLVILCLLERCLGCDQRLRGPFVHQLVDLLFPG